MSTGRKARTSPSALRGSPDARRAAVAVLEVLGGSKTTIDASQALGVTLARYYQLEARALQGVLDALEPRRKGKRRGPEQENERLRREADRNRREITRLQALLRVSQRAIGLATPSATERSKLGGKRRRRPTVRAMRAVEALRTGGEGTASPAGTTEPRPEARGPAVGA